MKVPLANLFGKNSHPLTTLIEVLDQSRTLVSRKENDFVRSGWTDREEALNEIDSLMHRMVSGMFPLDESSLMFAPTGKLQELSLSNGWSDEYMTLANKLDSVLER